MRTKLFCWLIILLSGIKLSAQIRPDSSQAGEGLDYSSVFGTIIGGCFLNVRTSSDVDDFEHANYETRLGYSQDGLFMSFLQYYHGQKDSHSFGLVLRPHPSFQFYAWGWMDANPRTERSSESSQNYQSMSLYEEKSKSIMSDFTYLSDDGKLSFSRQAAKWWYYTYSDLGKLSETQSYFLLKANQVKFDLSSAFYSFDDFSSSTSTQYPIFQIDIPFLRHSDYNSHYLYKSFSTGPRLAFNVKDLFYGQIYLGRTVWSTSQQISTYTKIYNQQTGKYEEEYSASSGEPKGNSLGIGATIGKQIGQNIYQQIQTSYSSDWEEQFGYDDDEKLKKMETETYHLNYAFYYLNSRNDISKSQALSVDFYGSQLPKNGYMLKSVLNTSFQNSSASREWTNNDGMRHNWTNNFVYQLTRHISTEASADFSYYNAGYDSIWNTALRVQQNLVRHLSTLYSTIALTYKNYEYNANYYTWEKRISPEFRYFGPILQPGWWQIQLSYQFPNSRWNWFTTEENPFSNQVEFDYQMYYPPKHQSKFQVSTSFGLFRNFAASLNWRITTSPGSDNYQYLWVRIDYRPIRKCQFSLDWGNGYIKDKFVWKNTGITLDGTFYF